jgi:tetratricopeptide (TPR) repeat protein
MQGICRFCLGQFRNALALFEQCLPMKDHSVRAWHVALIGEAVYTHMLSWHALTLACLGELDQGDAIMREAILCARQQYAFSETFVSLQAAMLNSIVASPQGIRHHAESAISLATDNGFSLLLSYAHCFLGNSIATSGATQEGLFWLETGFSECRACGAIGGSSLTLALLASHYAKLGRLCEAYNFLQEAFRFIESTNERWGEAYVHLVRGDLLAAAGEPAGAEQCFEKAIAIARSQASRLWELRAVTSLARLWRDQGKRTEAHGLLAPIYGWFTVGFNTPVLKEAKALLDELAA